MAMASQLLGADLTVRRRFFEATRLHYQVPLLGQMDLPSWQRARQRLLSDNQESLPPIDVASFGTPLRYRWNTQVLPNQPHFVQHRPLDAEHPEQASFSGSMLDVMNANAGDYIQQCGIVGTDFLPSIFAWRIGLVERRMQRMFEPGCAASRHIEEIETRASRLLRWHDLVSRLSRYRRWPESTAVRARCLHVSSMVAVSPDADHQPVLFIVADHSTDHCLDLDQRRLRREHVPGQVGCSAIRRQSTV